MLSRLSPQDIPNWTYGICDIHHITYPHSYPQGAGLCGANHKRHADTGLDFWAYLCYNSIIQKNKEAGHEPSK